jgi:hypothetical protein
MGKGLGKRETRGESDPLSFSHASPTPSSAKGCGDIEVANVESHLLLRRGVACLVSRLTTTDPTLEEGERREMAVEIHEREREERGKLKNNPRE